MKGAMIAVVLLAASLAHGERAVEVRGRGTCPSSEALRAALHDIDSELVERPGAFVVTVEGDAARAHVTAGASSRALTEADCGARAKSAAVFVTLLLEEPGPAPAAVPAPAMTKRAPRWNVAIDAAVIFAAARTERAFTGGGSLRAYAGNRFVGALVGLEGLAPVTLKGTVEDVRLARIPVDVGLRLRYVTHRIELSLDLELEAGAVFTRGIVPGGRSAAHHELGARLSARVAYHAWRRVAPFAAVQADIEATQYALSSAGAVLTHTPRAWLGFAVGGSVDLP